MFKKLIGNRLIVEVQQEEDKGEEKTESGIILPQTRQKQKMHDEGTVVRVGPDCETVGEGDRIMFDVMAVRAVELDGKEYLILNEESVVGIL